MTITALLMNFLKFYILLNFSLSVEHFTEKKSIWTFRNFLASFVGFDFVFSHYLGPSSFFNGGCDTFRGQHHHGQ